MIEKGDWELKRWQMLKAARTAIRLKHSLAADEEINRRLPALEKAIDAALGEGRPFTLTVGRVFDETDLGE